MAFESLESRQMLSGSDLASAQQLTADPIDAVLRSAPVELLQGTREFTGSTAESIADSPVFTDGSFTVEATVRPNALRMQSILTKYDSGAGDTSFSLGMLADGRLQFDVYGNPRGQNYTVFRTNVAPLTAGQWQRVTASFDIQKQKLSIGVNGQEVPGETVKVGADVTALYDSVTPVRVGARVTGGGLGNFFAGGIRDVRFYPVASYGIPEEAAVEVNAAATDATIAQTTAEDQVLGPQQVTAESIDAVLRSAPVELLQGTKQFTGSQMEVIADSPVFTDGSFTLEVDVLPNALKSQSLITKYDSSVDDTSFSLGMLADGRLQFDVYGNPCGQNYTVFRTNAAPLAAGQWQRLTASFDLPNEKFSITVNGQDIPGTIIKVGLGVTTLHDGATPVRLGVMFTRQGPNQFFDGEMRNVRFYPVASYGIPEEAAVEVNAAATDATITQTTAEDQVLGPQQVTAESIDAVLRSAPVELLQGTKQFTGSQMEVIADSPVFTDGSFTLEADVLPNALKSQSLITKYDSSADDTSFSLGMLADGRLQFDVYGNPCGQNYTVFRTNAAPLAAGQWQRLTASFDLPNEKFSITVNGQDIPGTIIKVGLGVTTLHDGATPVRLGVMFTRQGPNQFFDGEMRNVRFYPVASYGIPENMQQEQPPAADAQPAAPDAASVTDSPPADAGTETIAENLSQLDQAVTDVLQEMLAEESEAEVQPQMLTDSPDFSDAYQQDGLWKADLNALGGTAAMRSWQGRGGAAQIQPVSGQEGRRAAIAVSLQEGEIAATPALASVLGLPEGIQRDGDQTTDIVTRQTLEWGRVSVSVHNNQYRTIINQGGVIAGRQQDQELGQTDMAIRFLDRPQYVQWVEAVRLSNTGSLRLYVAEEDGSEYELTAEGTGCVVIGKRVSVLALYPSGAGARWGLRAINAEEPAPQPAFEDTWMKMEGQLAGIDLSEAEHAVQAVNLTVRTDRPGNTVQAIAYRGEDRLGAQPVGPDGSVRWEDPAGITSILLTESDPSATLYVTDMAVGGREGSVPPAATALTPLGNTDIGMIAAPQWEHGEFNWAEVQARSGVMGQRGGYENRVNGSLLFAPGTQLSETQYTRFDVRPTSGDANIAGIRYTDFDGLRAVPAGWYDIVGGKTVILPPGGPKHIVLVLTGNGTFDIGHALGDRASDIAPSQAMKLRSAVLVVRKVGPPEGLCSYPMAVSSENEHARAGGAVNMLYGILNDGLGGGPITARIRVGQTGTTADPVVGEFTGTIDGMQSLGLSVNVTLAHDYDVASLEVLGPDGQSSLTGWIVRPPKLARTFDDEQSVADQAAFYASRRGQTLQGRIANAIANSPKLQSLAYAYHNAIVPRLTPATPAPTEQPAQAAGQPEEQDPAAIVDQMLVAMAEENPFPDSGWSETEGVLLAMLGELQGDTTVEVEERLEFGSKIEAALASYLESHDRPSSDDTMILVFYGSGQQPGPEFTFVPRQHDTSPGAGIPGSESDWDQDSELNQHDTNAGAGICDSLGFDNLMLNLKRKYAHAWAFPSGRNLSQGEIVDDVRARGDVRDFIRQIPTDYPNISHLMLVGYSWGGGQVYETARWLTEESDLPLDIVGSVYVDAVNQGNINVGTAETRLPPGTKSFLNIYQSNADLIEDSIGLNGAELRRPEGLPREVFFQIDADAGSNAQRHGCMDEYSVPTILRYLDALFPLKRWRRVEPHSPWASGPSRGLPAARLRTPQFPANEKGICRAGKNAASTASGSCVDNWLVFFWIDRKDTLDHFAHAFQDGKHQDRRDSPMTSETAFSGASVVLDPREIPRARKRLAFDHLLRHVLRPRVKQFPDARHRDRDYTVADAVLSALAMFSLKDPSLLAFQNRRNDENMKTLYRIENVPSDTQMREILDPLEPDLFRPLFQDVFRELQRGKALEPFVFYQGSYLLSLDGTEYFSSEKVHCPCCLQRKHKNGQVTYYHQLLGATLVHPDHRAVIPFAPEAIVQQDGQTKNDCERNASKRLLEKLRREHPQLNLTIVEDGLASNAPHIRLLKQLRFHFILGAKPDDHQHLFSAVERASREGRLTTLRWTEAGKGLPAAVQCELRFVNEVPLNQANEDLLVNFLQYTEYDVQGRVLKRFSWVTDFTITAENAEWLMRGGRSRWKIENETFNTLKNQGYHFEHNYGHGQQHLSVVFAMLMMLAFLLDQVQALCCPTFQAVRAKFSSLRLVWDHVRSHFRHFQFASMEHLYDVILSDAAKALPAPCFGRRYAYEDDW